VRVTGDEEDARWVFDEMTIEDRKESRTKQGHEEARKRSEMRSYDGIQITFECITHAKRHCDASN
jgi:hypothetical protein